MLAGLSGFLLAILTGTLVPLSLLGRLTGPNIFSTYMALGIPFCGAAILAAICVRAILAECALPHHAAA